MIAGVTARSALRAYPARVTSGDAGDRGDRWTLPVSPPTVPDVPPPHASPGWIPGPPRAAKPGGRALAVGIIGLVVAAPATLGLVVLAALLANPCGAFADGCDDYGETSTSGVVAAGLAGLAALVTVAALVAIVVGLALRWSSR